MAVKKAVRAVMEVEAARAAAAAEAMAMERKAVVAAEAAEVAHQVAARVEMVVAVDKGAAAPLTADSDVAWAAAAAIAARPALLHEAPMDSSLQRRGSRVVRPASRWKARPCTSGMVAMAVALEPRA